MGSDEGQSRYEPGQQQQLFQRDENRCSGEGAASALEHLRSMRNQQARLTSAGGSGSEAVLSDT